MRNATAAILQSNYIPWKGYFDLIHDADIFIFYDEVQYTKNDWRNRNVICPKNGPHWLTIPISKDAVKLKISEVSLTDNRWQKKHYTSLCESYGKAPFFGDLMALLGEVYLDQQWNSLSQLNRFIIERISSMLGCETRFIDSASLHLENGRIDRLISILEQLDADSYISGPSAHSYLGGSEHLFADHGIRLSYKDYSGYPAYRQMTQQFEPTVSVLDLIANVGIAAAPWYVWGWRQDRST